MPKLKKTLNINIISLKTGLDQIYAMFKNLKAYFLNFFCDTNKLTFKCYLTHAI